MPKIVSGIDEKGQLIKFLQKIVESAAAKLTSQKGVEMKPAETLTELVQQVDELMAAYMLSTHSLAEVNYRLQESINEYVSQVDFMQDELSKFIGDIGYDDAIDEATGDLMQSLVASGAAETNQDGDLAFDPRVMLSRSDLKPMVRDAIVTWIEKKMSE